MEKREIFIDFSNWPVRPSKTRPKEPGAISDWANQWEDYGRARRNAAKHYLGRTYAQLYQGLFRGRLPNFNCQQGTLRIGKKDRLFRPDVIRLEEGNNHYIEIKANSFRRGSFSLGALQLENYCGVILQEGSSGSASPFFEYAFFRHGTRREYNTLVGESKETPPSQDRNFLLERITTQTKDLIIVPVNLLIFLLAHGDYHRIETRDQETSDSPIDSQRYFCLKSGVVSILHNKHRGINTLLTKPRARDLCEMVEKLGLEALRVQRTELPKGFSINGREVKPFPVTRFYMSPEDEKAWFKTFQKHHADILTKWLEIDDLFGEVDAEVSPF